MERKIYLEDIPLDQAQDQLRQALEACDLWGPLAPEIVPLEQARGRVTARAVFARLSAPHYHAAAMDGYALRARDTVGATETRPLSLSVVDNDESAAASARPAQAVNTGHPLPLWADAVVMVEHVEPVTTSGEQAGIEIRAAVPPWHHVRPMGEDMVATELVLPANHRLRPVDLGALAAAGHTTVDVYRRPRVAVIPTGSELVALQALDEQLPEPGQVIEFNSIVLAAQLAEWGADAHRWPIVDDEFEAIQQAVKEAAADHDLILLNAGSSAGTEDFTASVVESLGTVLVHGVAVRPGHPVIIGRVPRTGDKSRCLPIIGVPGYPVSAALTGEIFVEPIIRRWTGASPSVPPTLEGTLTRKVNSPTGDDEFLRVQVGNVGERWLVTPISRGAGVISSLVRADGIVRIPRFSEGRDAGERVTVDLYRSPAEIEKTVVAIGSHDLTLDLLAQFLAARSPGRRLMSANVGSLGGLVALKRGQAHFAGSHLLDPESGLYNDAYVGRYLAGVPCMLITLVERQQGWIVPQGNPAQLRGWRDLLNPDMRFVNRQRGAGTRVLLDYEMGKRAIVADRVQGYEREEFTHLAVAAAVASGTANAGLGIAAAATALDLDFVPLAQERYELVIPHVHYEDPLLEPLLALLQDEEFRQTVAAMPGYNVQKMGQERSVNK